MRTSVNPVVISHVHVLPPTRSLQLSTSPGRASCLLTVSARGVITGKMSRSLQKNIV